MTVRGGIKLNFNAEIIRTSQRKLASNDNQYELVLRTENPMILDLGKLPSDTLFTVEITLNDIKNGVSQEEKEHNGI